MVLAESDAVTPQPSPSTLAVAFMKASDSASESTLWLRSLQFPPLSIRFRHGSSGASSHDGRLSGRMNGLLPQPFSSLHDWPSLHVSPTATLAKEAADSSRTSFSGASALSSVFTGMPSTPARKKSR